MALITACNFSGRRNLVRICQRETGAGVVERRIRPCDRVVTGRTERGRKASGNVVRHSATKGWGAVPSRLVAAVAIRVRGSEGIVVAHVAIGAGHDFACRRQLVRAG